MVFGLKNSWRARVRAQRALTGPKPTGGVNFYTYIGSTLFKWQLLKLYIYWVHRGGIMYPTLEMAKTCLKRSLFED